MKTIVTSRSSIAPGLAKVWSFIAIQLSLSVCSSACSRAAISVFGGRFGSTIAWAMVSVIVAVVVGAGYPIYASTKRTVDQTGLTTGQFGQ